MPENDTKTKPIQLQLSPCEGAGPPVFSFNVKCRLRLLFQCCRSFSRPRMPQLKQHTSAQKRYPKRYPKQYHNEAPRNCGCRCARGVANFLMKRSLSLVAAFLPPFFSPVFCRSVSYVCLSFSFFLLVPLFVLRSIPSLLDICVLH